MHEVDVVVQPLAHMAPDGPDALPAMHVLVPSHQPQPIADVHDAQSAAAHGSEDASHIPPVHVSVPEHASPSQHGSPSRPHPPDAPSHIPSTQTLPIVHSDGPRQHSCPASPHGTHVSPLQVRPAWQTSPSQHGSRSAPQPSSPALHVPSSPHKSPAQQSVPVRHAEPTGPQHPPPTQSRSPQQSAGPVHRAPRGTAQHVPSLSHTVPLEQSGDSSQHSSPTSPQFAGDGRSGGNVPPSRPGEVDGESAHEARSTIARKEAVRMPRSYQ